MPTLTPMQVAAAAYLGGFRGDGIATAVAVARGESGFATDHCNSQYCGLWQIGTQVNKSHLHGDWKDPAVNARAAKELVDARGWCGGKAANGHCQNFEAYGLDNGGASWQSKLDQGKRAKENLDDKVHSLQIRSRLSLTGQIRFLSYAEACRQILKEAGIETTQGGETDPLDAGANAVGDALQFFTFPKLEGLAKALTDAHTWLRLAEVALGGVLVVVALVQLTGATKLAGVLPAGRIAKALK